MRSKASRPDRIDELHIDRVAIERLKLDPASAAYRDLMMKFPAMLDWTAAARSEPEEVEELDVEF